jgi:BolA family transcriptional regulator, general stress-responsive regulator
MNRAEEIHRRLSVLEPQVLQLTDDSHRHVGHAGAASGGGHFQLFIVSEKFAAQSRLARQRAVLNLLNDLMHGQIHALSMRTLSPAEYAAETQSSK